MTTNKTARSRERFLVRSAMFRAVRLLSFGLIGWLWFITVCKIRGDRIAIGIQAPREVPIMRKELLPMEELPEEETNR
jgi:hypothetical protein